VEITVQHVGEADAWRVTYVLPAPARALGFLRTADGLRHAWRLALPEAFAFRDPPAGTEVDEILTRKDGAPFESMTFEVATTLDKPPKNYPPFRPLTDGSMAVYTGYYDAVPLSCTEAMGCTLPSVRVPVRFTFVGRSREHVVVGGADPATVAHWSGSEDGTFAYFGALAPISTRDLTAVVDPGMPPWLHAGLSDLLPKLFAYYTLKTGHSLFTRPLIVMSYADDPDPDGNSWNGSTLPGMIEFDARLGKNYRSQENPWVKQWIPYLVAHESAHLWNNGEYTNTAGAGGGAWVHEGGADAFAYRALRDLGVETRAEYHGRLSDALSRCAFGLRLLGEPLVKSNKAGYFTNYYYCGSTIALWTEAVMSSTTPSGDLFPFWRDLFRASTEKHYDDTLYSKLLSERSKDVASLVHYFAETRIGEPEVWLSDVLTKVGVQIREDDGAAPLSVEYTMSAGRQAANVVFERDGCVGAGGRKTGNKPCRTLPANVTLDSIAGHDLARDGVRAFDALASACRNGTSAILVTLHGERQDRSVPCGGTVPLRPRYRTVVRAPFD
jgi:hypothetical protein